MSIKVGGIVTEGGHMARPLMRDQHSHKDTAENTEYLRPIPVDWPESLRRIFAEEERHASRNRLSGAGGARPAAEHEQNVNDGDTKGDKPDEGASVGEDDDEQDLQVITGYEFTYGRKDCDVPLQSIEEGRAQENWEELSERTATTPNGDPFRPSPRTLMYLRRQEYDGPSYMRRRSLSPIHKPRASPIFTTPSLVRMQMAMNDPEHFLPFSSPAASPEGDLELGGAAYM